MSLLDNGPHTAIITTYKEPDSDDEFGDRAPVVDKTFELPGCSFAPVSSDDVQLYGGKAVDTSYSVVHRNWPGGPYTHVRWGNFEFVQVGDTLIMGRGVRTRHTKAFLRTTTAKVR